MTAEPPAETRSPPASRVALIALMAVWLAFDAPALSGRVLFPTDIASGSASVHNPLESDAVQLYQPWRSYLGDRLRNGDIPLWDPHRFAGTPFAADPQTAVWYPPNWLFALGETTRILTLVAVLSRAATLLFAYWFFRVIRLHPFAAAAGSIAFSFSGFLVAWDVHPTFRASAMWLPLALGGLETIYRGRPRLGVPLAGLGLGLSVLGGHPQVAAYVWLASGLWVIVSLAARAISRRNEGGVGVAAYAALSAGAFVLGFGLGAIQILGSAELAAGIVRGPESQTAVQETALRPDQVLTLFVPDRFGNPIDGNAVGRPNYSESALWVGIPATILALLAATGRRGRLTAGFGAIGVVGFLGALGAQPFLLLHTLVPGLSQTRGISRMVLLVDLGLAGLAALGLDATLRGRVRPRRILWACAAVVGGVVLALLLVRQPSPVSPYVLLRAGLAVAATAAAAAVLIRLTRRSAPGWAAAGILLLLAADLWAVGFRYHAFQPVAPLPRPHEVAVLQAAPGPRARFVRTRPIITANGALIHGLYGLDGSDSFIPRRPVEVLEVAEDGTLDRAQRRNVVGPFDPQWLGSHVFDLAGVEWVLGTRDPEVGAPQSGDGAIVRRPGSFPSAFTVMCWELVAGDAALERIRDMDSGDLGSVALVEDGQETRDQLGGSRLSGCAPQSPAVVERYDPESVSIHASVTAPSVLVLTDAWFPGWKVTVDGRPSPILLVDHAFRGVALPAGEHSIRFRYRPGWLVPGAIVTLTALSLAVGLILRVDRLPLRLLRRLR